MSDSPNSALPHIESYDLLSNSDLERTLQTWPPKIHRRPHKTQAGLKTTKVSSKPYSTASTSLTNFHRGQVVLEC